MTAGPLTATAMDEITKKKKGLILYPLTDPISEIWCPFICWSYDSHIEHKMPNILDVTLSFHLKSTANAAEREQSQCIFLKFSFSL